MINLTLHDMLIRTNSRQPSFELMLNHLHYRQNPLIIETGCARSIHYSWDSGFAGDGNSTFIFDKFLSQKQGQLFTVDKDPNSINHAQNYVGPNCTLICDDSIKFLWSLSKTLEDKQQYVDLLYLDSYDLDPNNYHPSAMHHLKELLAIISRLKPGTMIAVDDNLGTVQARQGKGAYVEEFMRNIDVPLVYDGYQLLWIL